MIERLLRDKWNRSYFAFNPEVKVTALILIEKVQFNKVINHIEQIVSEFDENLS